MKKYLFLILGIILLMCCISASAEPLSDAYGSIQFKLPDGFSLSETTDEYKAYISVDGKQQIQVGTFISLEQLNTTHFLGSVDDLIDMFVSFEQQLFSMGWVGEVNRLFVGDLPSLHVKADSEEMNREILLIFNRYDSMAITFDSSDNTELVDYFIENVTAKLTPQ